MLGKGQWGQVTALGGPREQNVTQGTAHESTGMEQHRVLLLHLQGAGEARNLGCPKGLGEIQCGVAPGAGENPGDVTAW